VNGRKVNVPSYILRVNDVVELREKSRKVARINEALDGVMRRGMPSWVELDRDAFKGSLKTLPVREEMTTPAFQEQLIVELYSKKWPIVVAATSYGGCECTKTGEI
jgi:small subunit ribosomal protein S4